MEIKDILVIAVEFSPDPGAREEKDGANSGDLFLKNYLKPRFNKAVKEGYILKIDLDGVFGYPSSFISGSFGALSMEYGSEIVLKHLDFKSERRPIREKKIISEIKQPETDYK
jgi:hypothetical protein